MPVILPNVGRSDHNAVAITRRNRMPDHGKDVTVVVRSQDSNSRYTDVSRTRRFPDRTIPGLDVSRRTIPGQDVSRTGRFPYTYCPGIVFLEKCLSYTLFINSHKLIVT